MADALVRPRESLILRCRRSLRFVSSRRLAIGKMFWDCVLRARTCSSYDVRWSIRVSGVPFYPKDTLVQRACLPMSQIDHRDGRERHIRQLLT